jgi:hypothetical protein
MDYNDDLSIHLALSSEAGLLADFLQWFNTQFGYLLSVI